MKQPLQKLRRFFARPKKFNATANPEALSAAYDDDDGASRLSGAFVIVLVLHIIALVGVFAFARIKDSRAASKSAVVADASEAAADGGKKNTASKQPAATPAAAPASTPAPVKQTVTAGAQVNAGVAANVERTTTPEPRTPAKGVHIVKAGDNLTKIANQHGVTIADLVKANGLKLEDDLKINQELKVPEASRTPARTVAETKPKATEPVAANTYVVRKNDSLIKIANNLGVKYEDLVKLNNIKDPKKLQEGQKLKVPRKG